MDIPIDMVDMNGAKEIFEKIMMQDGVGVIVTPNSEIVVNAGKDHELKNIIENAELVIPDGIGLVYASKILGYELKDRVTGIDFLNEILEYLSKNDKTLFLLGSKNTEPKCVAQLAADKMCKKYPDLKIAGVNHGYFKEDEETEIVKAINESGADFLCVALGSPKQEKFINKYKDMLKVKGAIGVGGCLDVWAGNVERAPEFYQNHGLEWFYRLIKEPSRYKRMGALPVFMMKVLKSKFIGGKYD